MLDMRESAYKARNKTRQFVSQKIYRQGWTEKEWEGEAEIRV